MKGHLSPEQVSAWILGESNPELDQHLRECSPCQTELTSLKTALLMFRESAQDWAHQHRPAAAHTLWSIKRERYRKAGLAVSLALVMIFVLVSLRQPRRQEMQLNSSLDDTIIFEQVDAEVSRAVPLSMQPLTELVSWELPQSTFSGPNAKAHPSR